MCAYSDDEVERGHDIIGVDEAVVVKVVPAIGFEGCHEILISNGTQGSTREHEEARGPRKQQ
jgi:hypothetical protein